MGDVNLISVEAAEAKANRAYYKGRQDQAAIPTILMYEDRPFSEVLVDARKRGREEGYAAGFMDSDGYDKGFKAAMDLIQKLVDYYMSFPEPSWAVVAVLRGLLLNMESKSREL